MFTIWHVPLSYENRAHVKMIWISKSYIGAENDLSAFLKIDNIKIYKSLNDYHIDLKISEIIELLGYNPNTNLKLDELHQIRFTINSGFGGIRYIRDYSKVMNNLTKRCI